MNVKENVFSSERVFKKPLRDTLMRERDVNSYQQWQIVVKFNIPLFRYSISIIT